MPLFNQKKMFCSITFHPFNRVAAAIGGASQKSQAPDARGNTDINPKKDRNMLGTGYSLVIF